MQNMVVGLNIKSAPIELLEALSIHHSSNAQHARALKEAAGLDAVVILSTCNRLEVYATCDDAARGVEGVRACLIGRSGMRGTTQEARLRELLYSFSGAGATRHLFEVACGLDSLIVGEAEILGQVSRAYKTACEAGTTGKMANVWFQRALHLGKRARTETDIERYSLSVGRIAVELAVGAFGSVEDKQVLILGAGEMSELTMKYLIAHRFPVVMVTNRSFGRARTLADRYGFEAHPLSSLPACLEKADVVFSATSAKAPMIDRRTVEQVMRRRPERPLLFVDMAVPRDVDPAVEGLAGVSVHNINELRAAADRNRTARARAAAKVRQLIEQEAADFEHWVQSLELVPVITAFRQRAEQIKAARLEAALAKLPGLSPSQVRTVRTLATTITDQLIHDPIESLNAQAGTVKTQCYAQMLQELFALDVEAPGPAASSRAVAQAPVPAAAAAEGAEGR